MAQSSTGAELANFPPDTPEDDEIQSQAGSLTGSDEENDTDNPSQSISQQPLATQFEPELAAPAPPIRPQKVQPLSARNASFLLRGISGPAVQPTPNNHTTTEQQLDQGLSHQLRTDTPQVALAPPRSLDPPLDEPKIEQRNPFLEKSSNSSAKSDNNSNSPHQSGQPERTGMNVPELAIQPETHQVLPEKNGTPRGDRHVKGPWYGQGPISRHDITIEQDQKMMLESSDAWFPPKKGDRMPTCYLPHNLFDGFRNFWKLIEGPDIEPPRADSDEESQHGESQSRREKQDNGEQHQEEDAVSWDLSPMSHRFAAVRATSEDGNDDGDDDLGLSSDSEDSDDEPPPSPALSSTPKSDLIPPDTPGAPARFAEPVIATLRGMPVETPFNQAQEISGSDTAPNNDFNDDNDDNDDDDGDDSEMETTVPQAYEETLPSKAQKIANELGAHYVASPNPKTPKAVQPPSASQFPRTGAVLVKQTPTLELIDRKKGEQHAAYGPSSSIVVPGTFDDTAQGNLSNGSEVPRAVDAIKQPGPTISTSADIQLLETTNQSLSSGDMSLPNAQPSSPPAHDDAYLSDEMAEQQLVNSLIQYSSSVRSSAHSPTSPAGHGNPNRRTIDAATMRIDRLSTSVLISTPVLSSPRQLPASANGGETGRRASEKEDAGRLTRKRRSPSTDQDDETQPRLPKLHKRTLPFDTQLSTQSEFKKREDGRKTNWLLEKQAFQERTSRPAKPTAIVSKPETAVNISNHGQVPSKPQSPRSAIYEAFKAAYPQYKPDVKHLSKFAEIFWELRKRHGYSFGLCDAFIVKRAVDYPIYLEEGLDENPIPYAAWFSQHQTRDAYTKGIVTVKNIKHLIPEGMVPSSPAVQEKLSTATKAPPAKLLLSSQTGPSKSSPQQALGKSPVVPAEAPDQVSGSITRPVLAARQSSSSLRSSHTIAQGESNFHRPSSSSLRFAETRPQKHRLPAKRTSLPATKTASEASRASSTSKIIQSASQMPAPRPRLTEALARSVSDVGKSTAQKTAVKRQSTTVDFASAAKKIRRSLPENSRSALSSTPTTSSETGSSNAYQEFARNYLRLKSLRRRPEIHDGGESPAPSIRRQSGGLDSMGWQL